MNEPKAEASRWLEQAEDDLDFARHAMAGDFFHQVCFISQQAAEQALKALHFADGARSIIGHSVVSLLRRLLPSHPRLDALKDLVAELDLFYIPTRYPNGLVEGTPRQAFTRSQAERALAAAETILGSVKTELGD